MAKTNKQKASNFQLVWHSPVKPITRLKRIILKILGIIIIESTSPITLGDVIRRNLVKNVIDPLYDGNLFQYLGIIQGEINREFPNTKITIEELANILMVSPNEDSLVSKEEINYSSLVDTIKKKMVE